MKTALSVVVIAFFIVMVTPTNSLSQTKNSHLNVAPLPVVALVLPVMEGVAVNEFVNARTTALQNFTKFNKNAAEVTWSKIAGGFIAQFSTPDVDTKVAYNKKGVWQYNLCAYMEDHLPLEVRDVVRHQYYDYHILVCYAYKINGGPVYIIKMEDSKSIKTVRVSDGEMVEIENYIRS
jgi:hypothetical protein